MRMEYQSVSKMEVGHRPITAEIHLATYLAKGIGEAAAALRDETSTPEERIKCVELTLTDLLSRQRSAMASSETLLTPRQSGVLRLICQGQSNKSIARSLGIAPETVKSYAKQIFRKLNAQNRAEAVALAAQSNLI
jgi:LuxR family maltose regulon positive regulatory protein